MSSRLYFLHAVHRDRLQGAGGPPRPPDDPGRAGDGGPRESADHHIDRGWRLRPVGSARAAHRRSPRLHCRCPVLHHTRGVLMSPARPRASLLRTIGGLDDPQRGDERSNRIWCEAAAVAQQVQFTVAIMLAAVMSWAGGRQGVYWSV